VHARVSSAIDVEDLVQIGMVALIEAARSFEDRGHAAFATYASVRVRGAMIDQLRKGATLVRSAMRRKREWGQVRARLEGQLGRAATDEEMAAALELPLPEYRAALAQTHAAQSESLDDVYSDHSQWFASDDPDAHDCLEQDRRRRAIAAAIATLPEREAQVLQLYFVEELNLEEIGEVLGVGAARICQIKKAALTKLRGQLTGWADD
jgi:RNA polymerase sigma factor for flagellar operon FliA